MPNSESQLPLSLRRALSRPVRKGELKTVVKHVVFLMQENRSFDHYFYDFPGVRGRDDRNAILLPDGHPVFSQPDGNNRLEPRLLADDGSQDSSTAHDWTTGHEAWNRGWSDKWVAAKGDRTMTYYGKNGVPLYRELADTFTICDAYHSSVMSETASNRNYLFTGYGGYEPDGTRVISPAAHDRESPGTYSPYPYNWPSHPERLQEKGVTWKVYQEWDNFWDNNLEYHAAFRQIAQLLLSGAGLDTDCPSLYNFYARLSKLSPAEQDQQLVPFEIQVKKLTGTRRELYERGLTRSRPHGATAKAMFEAFRDDITAGTLPQVSYLVAPSAGTEHPGYSIPSQGEKVVYQALDAIAENPEVWDSTILIISYDENDGLFDHVPPPVPPLDYQTLDTEYVDIAPLGISPLGLGNRVPLIVVSPWTAGGYVCSQVFDHTSQVRFLENWLGVRQPLISSWRRTVAGDLSSVFDFGQTQQRIVETDRPARPARPLPYQPDANGALDPSHSVLTLTMTNSGPASAHFTLYPYRHEYDDPRHFDVSAAASEGVPIPADGQYAVTLTGPNGFRREFQGRTTSAGADVTATTTLSANDLTLTLTLHNGGTSSVTATVHADFYTTGGQPAQKQYPLQPGASTVITWNTSAAHGWYDLTLTLAEDTSFKRRLMGHIENGSASVSG
ncbi:alkaline phosphatase family protein [Streptomyces sp. NPDC048290]|uniref:alkaline phosphatase family protein n=1 Tax=Streptomyces sp. NPDC048290 TaxID=3155811 RepID=UPI00341809B2